MKPIPPLTDAIITALAELVDDSQKDRREPSHDQLGFQIKRAGLAAVDPATQAVPVGKAKRVRAVLSQSLEGEVQKGQVLVAALVADVKGLGGFRPTSTNFVGKDAIENLQAAFHSEGWHLATDGELVPVVLDALSGSAMTDALAAYVRRAQRGAEDAALLAGTGKDLLEATARHVIFEVWNSTDTQANFPTLLGQAFVALGLKTSQEAIQPGEPSDSRLQRALYDAGCAVNALRNKEGTGHGRPWLPSITQADANVAVQTMGIVANLLLARLAAAKR